MRRFLTFAIASIAIFAAAIGFGVPLRAQTPSEVGPYNVDMGVIVTNTLRTAGTVTSSQQSNVDQRGVVCTFVQTASSGSPSTTFSIQGYDAATASYVTYVTSGAITDTTPTAIAVYPGMQTSSLPSAMVALSAHLPRTWRVSQTVGGTGGPATTSKIGCVKLN